MGIELTAGGARAVVLPEYGGRLHQLFVPVGGSEEPLLVVPDDVQQYRARPTRGGSFPMAPWPNRIRDGRFRWGGREFELPGKGNLTLTTVGHCTPGGTSSAWRPIRAN